MADNNDPTTPTSAYAAMRPIWEKVATVLSGTEAMRAAGRKYLPQHEGELEEVYQERLQTAVLVNTSDLTLQKWVGHPFSDPVKLIESPTEIEELATNIDLEGSRLTAFGRKWFADGVAKAFSHVLVEFPRIEQPEGRERTLADDQREQLRPYWIHIPPERVVAMFADRIDGAELLTHVRILEETVGRDGFDEVITERVRQLDLVSDVSEDGAEIGRHVAVTLWRKVEDNKSGDEWVVEEVYRVDIDVIPLVTFYADREGLGVGKPPLLDLVNLNIRHWQSRSDQQAVLTVARFPILMGAGNVTDSDEKLRLGPRTVLLFSEPDADLKYVEHTGAAIAAGRQEDLDLKDEMAAYGAQFLVKRPGGETATARALDSAEATSQLQDVTMAFEGAINEALAMTARWMSIENPGAAEMLKDFGPEETSKHDLDTLINARKMRDISRQAFLTELIRRGLLAEDFDMDADGAKVEKEMLSDPTRDINPNDPDPDDPPDPEPEE